MPTRPDIAATALGSARRWCIFTSAGDRNCVRMWLGPGPERRWDLAIAYYGDNQHELAALAKEARCAIAGTGGKFQNLKMFIAANPGFFDTYSRVWVCDDDIRLTPAQIDELFVISERFDFWVAQPAFSSRGKTSHEITVTMRPLWDFRIVNFIEVGVPLFRRDKLMEFMEVFDGSLTGWGIDFWYMNVFKARERGRFAVIDRIAVINPPDDEKGGREIDRLRSQDDRIRDWHAAMAKHGLTEFSLQVFAYARIAAADMVTPTLRHRLLRRALKLLLRLFQSIRA